MLSLSSLSPSRGSYAITRSAWDYSTYGVERLEIEVRGLDGVISIRDRAVVRSAFMTPNYEDLRGCLIVWYPTRQQWVIEK